MALIKSKVGTKAVVMAVFVLVAAILTLVGKPEYALLINQNLGPIEEGLTYIVEETPSGNAAVVVSGTIPVSPTE